MPYIVKINCVEIVKSPSIYQNFPKQITLEIFEDSITAQGDLKYPILDSKLLIIFHLAS